MTASELKGINVIAPEEGNVFLFSQGGGTRFNYLIQTQEPFTALFPFNSCSQLPNTAVSLGLRNHCIVTNSVYII